MTDKGLYEQQQAEWVEHHKIKPGSIVKVLFKVPSHSRGWRNSWRDSMNKSVDNLMTVASIMPLAGIGLDDGYGYPFFCLEFVSNPEPEKVPEPATAGFITPEIAKRWGQKDVVVALAASVVKWLPVKEAVKGGVDVSFYIKTDRCPLCHWKEVDEKRQCPLNPSCGLNFGTQCCPEWFTFAKKPTEANAQIMIDKLVAELTKAIMNPEAK